MALPTPPSSSATDQALETLRPFYPGWPDTVLRILADRWISHGDINLAIAEVRASDEYALAFPGMVRADGSLRFASEQQYFQGKAMFDATLMSMGVNPAFFNQTWVDNLENEVSVDEQISRAEFIYRAVIDASPELRAWYALPENGGLADMTNEAILASALDPRVGEEILARRVGIAEIGAEASVRNLDADFELIERLYEVGITPDAAGEAFGAATEFIPIINTLARRHNDPDDDFDLNEFSAAQLLDDPFERRRMRNLLAQERASFAATGIFRAEQSGAITGLSLR